LPRKAHQQKEENISLSQLPKTIIKRYLTNAEWESQHTASTGKLRQGVTHLLCWQEEPTGRNGIYTGNRGTIITHKLL